MDKDKTAEKKAEARDDPPPTPQEMIALLLDSYTHNMQNAAPRTLEELRWIEALAVPPSTK